MDRLFKYEKVRFLFAGGFNTILDFLLLNSMVYFLHLMPLLANTISVSVGITISYFLNHYFVFRSQDRISLRKYLLFFCVTGFSSIVIQDSVIYLFGALTNSNFGRSLFIVGALYGHKTLELNFAKAAAVLMGMIWNFVLYKYIVFKPKQAKETVELLEL